MKTGHISALILFALLFTSCAQQAAPISSDNAADTTAAVTETETDYLQTLSAYKYENEDFKIIAQSVAGAQPVIPDEELTGEIVFDALYERDRTVEDTFGVVLDYTRQYDTVDLRTQLTSDLLKAVSAGDCQFSFAVNSLAAGLNSSATSGILVDMMTVPTLKLSEKWWSGNMYENLSYKGRLFATTGSLPLAYYYAPCILAYNQTIADDYSLPDMYSLILDGSWTLDRFAELSTALGNDVDGDGKMTESDFYAVACDELSAASFFIGVGGRHDETGDDGIPVFVVNSEANISKLEKVASLLSDQDNVMRTEQLSGASYTEKKTRTFKNGQSLFLAYNMSGLIDCLRDMENDYGIIPLPKWNEEQEKYLTYGSPFGAVGVAIPKSENDLERTGVIMEAMAYLSYRDVGPLMFDITLKEKVARDDSSKLMLDIIYEDIIFDWTTVYSIGNLNVLVRDIAIGKKSNFVSEYEKIKPTAEKGLQDILDAYEGN